jgi:quercetin dioxygenase-like cupin family protein
MSKEAIVVRSNEGQTLNVTGGGVRFLCTSDQTDHAWSMMAATLPTGSGPPPHDHPWDEAYYCVAGEVRFSLAGESVTVRPGDFVYAPAGTLHGFQGISESPAQLLIFDAPAHTEGFFKEVDREVKGPADFAKMPVIGRRHGIRFAVPASVD